MVGDEGLPFASSAGIAGKKEVRSKAELARDGREGLASVGSVSGGDASLEESLNEELSVEAVGSRVEGSSGNSGVDVILSSDGVRDEQINYFVRGEAGIAHAGQDGVNRVARFWDEEVWRGQRDVETSGVERNASTTSAVANTDGTSELDEVTKRYFVLDGKRSLDFNDLIDTEICGEGGFDLRVGHDGTISAETTKFALEEELGGESNSVVEGQTERLVDFFTALATIKEVLLNVVQNVEPDAAGCMSSGPAARACGALGVARSSERRYSESGESK